MYQIYYVFFSFSMLTAHENHRESRALLTYILYILHQIYPKSESSFNVVKYWIPNMLKDRLNQLSKDALHAATFSKFFGPTVVHHKICVHVKVCIRSFIVYATN